MLLLLFPLFTVIFRRFSLFSCSNSPIQTSYSFVLRIYETFFCNNLRNSLANQTNTTFFPPPPSLLSFHIRGWSWVHCTLNSPNDEPKTRERKKGNRELQFLTECTPLAMNIFHQTKRSRVTLHFFRALRHKAKRMTRIKVEFLVSCMWNDSNCEIF